MSKHRKPERPLIPEPVEHPSFTTSMLFVLATCLLVIGLVVIFG